MPYGTHYAVLLLQLIYLNQVLSQYFYLKLLLSLNASICDSYLNCCMLLTVVLCTSSKIRTSLESLRRTTDRIR
ncbi:hypothetical protein F4814DRAFT_363445 [Daldinia grandis]|nr:hypothetical protein F4814DRAFT_363445 [Daldinia grandis]